MATEVSIKKRKTGGVFVRGVTQCQPCSNGGETVFADAYCNDCEEFMCPNCTGVHKKLTATMSHYCKEIKCGRCEIAKGPNKRMALNSSAKNVQGTKSSQLDEFINKPCKQHPSEPIKYFCSIHQTLVCGHCLALEHRACEVKIISKICDDFKDSQEHKDVQKEFVQVLQDVNETISDSEKNIAFIKELGDIEISKLRKFRDEITKYLDEREKCIVGCIKRMGSRNRLNLAYLKTHCNQLKTSVEETLSKLNSPETNTFQLFILVKKVKAQLKDCHLSLDYIKKENAIILYRFEKDPATVNLLASKTGLGEIVDIVEQQI